MRGDYLPKRMSIEHQNFILSNTCVNKMLISISYLSNLISNLISVTSSSFILLSPATPPHPISLPSLPYATHLHPHLSITSMSISPSNLYILTQPRSLQVYKCPPPNISNALPSRLSNPAPPTSLPRPRSLLMTPIPNVTGTSPASTRPRPLPINPDFATRIHIDFITAWMGGRRSLYSSLSLSPSQSLLLLSVSFVRSGRGDCDLYLRIIIPALYGYIRRVTLLVSFGR